MEIQIAITTHQLLADAVQEQALTETALPIQTLDLLETAAELTSMTQAQAATIVLQELIKTGAQHLKTAAALINLTQTAASIVQEQIKTGAHLKIAA